MLVLGFVVVMLVWSSVGDAAVNTAQEHDNSNTREPAVVVGDLSVDSSEAGIAPEMAPIEGTITKRGDEEEEGGEEEQEKVMDEWATPSVSSPTEDYGSVPSGAVSVEGGDVGVSATGIEHEHTQQEDGGVEMGDDADDPRGTDDATSHPDTTEDALIDTSTSSSISSNNLDESIDASDDFVAKEEEDTDVSSSDRTHVSSSLTGVGDDDADIHTTAADEVPATGGGGGGGGEDEREDENERHQRERKQDQEHEEEATLERDTDNESRVASFDGVTEQALAGDGDDEGKGGTQAGKDGDGDSDSDSNSPGFDRAPLSDAATTTADSVAAEFTDDDIVDAATTAAEPRLRSTGVKEQEGSNEAQITSNAQGTALETDSTADIRDDNNEDTAGTDSSADSRRAAPRRPAIGGDRQQATPAGLSSSSDEGEGLTSSGRSRGRNQGDRRGTGRGVAGESKGELRENDSGRFGNGGGGDGGGGSGGTDDAVGHGGGVGFDRSSPEELVQRVRDVEAELLRKLLAEEDANSLLDM